MAFLIGLLTVLLVLDCIILVFLVLIQLPKKEAGAGLAFGAGATDALFGAGSGTVLTRITRYATTAFFILAVLLSVLETSAHNRGTRQFERNLSNPSAASTPASAPAVSPAPAPATPAVPTGSNKFSLSSTPAENPAAALTNAVTAPTTNPVSVPSAATNTAPK